MGKISGRCVCVLKHLVDILYNTVSNSLGKDTTRERKAAKEEVSYIASHCLFIVGDMLFSSVQVSAK